MDVVWLGLLGLLLAGWSVLDGAVLGLGGSLRRFGVDDTSRRLLLTALGPFLLGGEVWLVAAAGVLLAAFPGLEKDLLTAAYPVVVGLVVAWILRDIGVWFRSRRPSLAWRGGWERVVVVASTALPFAWGLLLAVVVQGVPTDGRAGVETLVGPYSLLWGAVVVAAFALHGAVFAALRLPPEHRARVAGTVRVAGLCAAASLGALAVATPVFASDAGRPWFGAAVLAVAAVVVLPAVRAFGAGRDGWAYVCTAAVAAAPVPAAGAASAPRLLDGLAAPATLDLLTVLVLPLVPVLLAVQAWTWWTFRHRVGAGSAVFF